MFHCQYYNLRVRCYECKNKKTCKICPRSIKLPQPRFTKPEFELSGLDQLMDYKIEVSSSILGQSFSENLDQDRHHNGQGDSKDPWHSVLESESLDSRSITAGDRI